MPTAGWILEDASDRYWETVGHAGLYPSAPKSYDCPYCERQFKSTQELSVHISVDHPIERPVLFIGRRMALSEQTIRTPINQEDIGFSDARRIFVSRDGGSFEEWSRERLRKSLSSGENAHYSIRLVNEAPETDRAVEASYALRVKIASTHELDNVDEYFVRMLAIDDVRMGDVRKFSDACAVYSSADEYSSALAVYVTGVLIKDQNESTGVSQPFSVYREKMQQAFETLRAFDRPVPRAVCAAIRFNLNDFKTPGLPCGIALLDAANEFYSAIARVQVVYPSDSECAQPDTQELPACPVDRESHELLESFRKLCMGVTGSSPVEELYEMIMARQLSDYDRTKLQVLAATAANQLGDDRVLNEVLENLVNDPVFGNWASKLLENED